MKESGKEEKHSQKLALSVFKGTEVKNKMSKTERILMSKTEKILKKKSDKQTLRQQAVWK